MNENCFEVNYPLDVIQFVSGNKRVYNFLSYLFDKAAEFNRENIEHAGENFFPVAAFNSRSFTYDIEYEFFVKTFVDYAVEIHGISKQSEENIYRFLYSSLETKINRARYIFFVVVLGNYFKFGSSFYNDLTKNTSMIFFERVIKNEYDVIARERVIQIRDFVKDKIENSDALDELHNISCTQVAYGKKRIEEYMKKEDIDNIQKVYKLDNILIDY